MNKKELISAVAEKSELGVSGVEKIIDNFMNVVSDEVCNGGQVNLRGFGAFSKRFCKKRVARNINTGASVEVPEHNKLSFTPAKRLMNI